jgi:hypothetical protein
MGLRRTERIRPEVLSGSPYVRLLREGQLADRIGVQSRTCRCRCRSRAKASGLRPRNPLRVYTVGSRHSGSRCGFRTAGAFFLRGRLLSGTYDISESGMRTLPVIRHTDTGWKPVPPPRADVARASCPGHAARPRAGSPCHVHVPDTASRRIDPGRRPKASRNLARVTDRRTSECRPVAGIAAAGIESSEQSVEG